MEIENGGGGRFYRRLGPPVAAGGGRLQKVCFHWQAGRCNRNPCPFLHAELPADGGGGDGMGAKRGAPFGGGDDRRFKSNVWKNPNNADHKWGRGRGRGGAAADPGQGPPPAKATTKLCNYWMAGNCQFGERCRYVHSWTAGEGLVFMTALEGHQKAVSGIAFPSGSDKLYSGSKDEAVRVWDCQSGQCAGIINLGGDVGCLISEGPWVFVGIPNAVKAWNTQTNVELSLPGPVGQVYALVAGNEMLFAGTQDGSILIWKYNSAVNNFEPAASLNGHTLAVVSLVTGANRLYSGSMDNTIKAWDLGTLQCLQTLSDHTSVVMSVLCWDQFLLSCSLDKTIKVWVSTEQGNLEVTYTHNEEHVSVCEACHSQLALASVFPDYFPIGVLSLCGMHDPQGKPILLCACNDNVVRLYDLPSFTKRGKAYSKAEVRAIQIGPGGLFFTGDGDGEVRVWNLLASEAKTS